MYRYDTQLLSYNLSILFFVITIAKILVRWNRKETSSIWIYVLHGVGWFLSISYYFCLFRCGDGFNGHGWSPVVRVLQYISFGSWMFLTLLEEVWEYYIKDNSLTKNISKRMENIWLLLTRYF